MTKPRSCTSDRLVHAGSLAASAAAAGILAGLASCQPTPSARTEPVTIELPEPEQPPPRSSRAEPVDPPPRRVPTAVRGAVEACCKARNECKGLGNCKVSGMHDCKGKNECKGKGGCRGSESDCDARIRVDGAKGCCAGKNDCKGLGGCKTQGSSCKGMNACKGQGGCKTSRCMP